MVDGERIKFRDGPLNGSEVDWDGGDFYELKLAAIDSHEAELHIYRRCPAERDTFEWQGISVDG